MGIFIPPNPYLSSLIMFAWLFPGYMAKKMAQKQREMQMSIEIARARDALQWYSGLYSAFVGTGTLAFLVGRPFPSFAAVPLVLGGFSLANMYDAAYGSKMARVVKEAENIMVEERSRFVPPKQAPFFGLYTRKEKKAYPYGEVKAVGAYWPDIVLPKDFEALQTSIFKA